MWVGPLIFVCISATTKDVWIIPSFGIWGYVLHIEHIFMCHHELSKDECDTQTGPSKCSHIFIVVLKNMEAKYIDPLGFNQALGVWRVQNILGHYEWSLLWSRPPVGNMIFTKHGACVCVLYCFPMLMLSMRSPSLSFPADPGSCCHWSEAGTLWTGNQWTSGHDA